MGLKSVLSLVHTTYVSFDFAGCLGYLAAALTSFSPAYQMAAGRVITQQVYSETQCGMCSHLCRKHIYISAVMAIEALTRLFSSDWLTCVIPSICETLHCHSGECGE